MVDGERLIGRRDVTVTLIGRGETNNIPTM